LLSNFIEIAINQSENSILFIVDCDNIID